MKKRNLPLPVYESTYRKYAELDVGELGPTVEDQFNGIIELVKKDQTLSHLIDLSIQNSRKNVNVIYLMHGSWSNFGASISLSEDGLVMNKWDGNTSLGENEVSTNPLTPKNMGFYSCKELTPTDLAKEIALYVVRAPFQETRHSKANKTHEKSSRIQHRALKSIFRRYIFQ